MKANGESISDTLMTRQGFVDLPGMRLAYEMAGHGAPVIFLHGGLLDRWMWDEQFAFLAHHYQAIRYDLRSAGQSETTPSSAPYTHHDDLDQLLQALQIGFAGGAVQLCDCPRFRPGLS